MWVCSGTLGIVLISVWNFIHIFFSHRMVLKKGAGDLGLTSECFWTTSIRGFVCTDLNKAGSPPLTIEEVSHYILTYDTSNWNLKSPIKEQPANLPRAILFVKLSTCILGIFAKCLSLETALKKCPRLSTVLGSAIRGGIQIHANWLKFSKQEKEKKMHWNFDLHNSATSFLSVLYLNL